MIHAETVVAGAENPGTEPQVLSSNAGHYVGYLDADGLPYSRETEYFPDDASASKALDVFVKAMKSSAEEARALPFIRR